MCVAFSTPIRLDTSPSGYVVGLVVLVAGVGLCFPDAGAGLGFSSAFGLEGCFPVLIGGFCLFEDADNVPALVSKPMPGSAILLCT